MNSSLKKLYGYDKQKATAGVWITLQDAETMEDGTIIQPPLRVKLGKIGTVAYNKALTKAMEPYQTKIRLTRGRLTPEENIKISIQVYADSILLDWDGATDDDGNPLECTRANKVEALTELEGFRERIEAEAGELENFREAIDIDSKNSRTISDTSVVSGGEDSNF